MKVFCDSNVLVAAFVANHPHHHSARPVVERVRAGSDEGFVALHSLAEMYAVLTRLPRIHHVPPGLAWQLINENVLKNFSLIALTPKEYAAFLEPAAFLGVEGGKIYDALLLAAAAKSCAQRIYTFNVRHFQDLANDDLRGRIVAP